jgi:hypothetical protein
VWNTPLTELEIFRMYQADDLSVIRPGNLIAYWPLSSQYGSSGGSPDRMGRYPLTVFSGTVAPSAEEPPVLSSTVIRVSWANLSGAAPGSIINPSFIGASTTLYAPIVPVDMPVGYIAPTTTMYAPTVLVEVDARLSFIGPSTIVVAPKLAQPIVNVTLPVISGTATEGLVVSCSTGTWTGTPPLTFAYQWRLCDSGGAACANITGATNPSYIVQAADVGGTLRCVVTASDL